MLKYDYNYLVLKLNWLFIIIYCIICNEEIKIGSLLMPCIHYQYCMMCIAKNVEDNCPLCRQKINHILHYYKDDKYGKDLQTIAKAINYN